MPATLLSSSRVIAPNAPRKTLAGTLDHLGISVFPIEQVREFQSQFRRKAIRSALVVGFFWSSLDLAIVAVCIWISSLLPNSIVGWAITLFFTITAIGFGAASVISLAVAFSKRRFMEWVTTTEEDPDFSKMMPKAARMTAMKIRRHLPGVRFSIMRFETDPFLFVRYETQRYCISHWDEPFVDH